MATKSNKLNMDRPSDSQKPTQKPKDTSKSFGGTYLIQYNVISAVLWAGVLGSVLFIATQYGPDKVYLGVGEFVKMTQTLAALEVIHSLTGTRLPQASISG